MFRNLLITILACLSCYTAQAETYYWVGGTGEWSDTSHWATTSGGNIFYGAIPSADDDVIFDQNSFFAPNQTVTIDVATASCRDFNWTAVQDFPAFNNLPSSSLIVNGDFELTPQMNYLFDGTLIFRGIGPQVVQGYDHNFGNTVYFDDDRGEWDILSPLNVSNRIFFRRGKGHFRNEISTNYLHIIPVDAASRSLIIFDANVTIRGSDTRVGATPFEAFKVNVNQSSLTFANGSQIEFLGAAVTARIEGSDQSIDFPVLNFSTPTGTKSIRADTGTNHRYAGLLLNSNGLVTTSSRIQNLMLAGGNTYRFGANQDFYIGGLDASGSCDSPIYLFSTSQGSQTRFETDDAIQIGDFMNIRDAAVTRGAFQITNAKDLGNTAGWQMTDLGSQDLYWVGGTGEWSDQNHWSYSSGGVGGACIPTPIDDVHFDGNSFSGPLESVTLTETFSYCRNMTWANVLPASAISFNGQQLNVSGSLALDPNMTFTMNGILRFNAFGEAHTILSAGHDLGSDVRMEAIGGTYTLLDDLTIRGRLLHVYGAFDAGDNDINLVRYYSNYGTARSLDISNSTVTIAAIPGLTAQWEIGTNGYTFNGASSQINVSSAITFVHRGSGQLDYNRVAFASTGNLYNYNAADIYFDYVSMALSSFVFQNNDFGTLIFSSAQSYTFSSGSVQRIDRLESIGSCLAPISLRAQTVGREAIFQVDVDQSEVHTTMVKDIHIQGSGIVRNINGIDNGNTDGWNMDGNASRNLYWVGDGGNWNDSQHWSASSNGPGGECIPTSIDNVFFDANSFNVNNQVVTGGNIFFRNMTWDGVLNNPAVSFGEAFTYGSIELSDNMNINQWSYIRLYGNEPNHTLDTRGLSFTHLELNGVGDWTLSSPIDARGQFFIYNGGLSTDGHDVRTERIRIWERNYLNIDISSSTINLFGNGVSVPQFAHYQSDAAQLDFAAGSSTINVEHANGYTLIGSNEISLNNLNFTSTTGRGLMDVRTTDRIEYNKVTFNNDGYLLREHAMDTLIFAPGHTYTLHSGRRQIINDHWEIMGAPCAPINLNASSIGVPATVEKINGDVTGNYINMRDQIGIGAVFNAGQHSTDIGRSNQGWIFEEITPENPDRGILGADQILCDDSSLDLAAFTLTQNLTYAWNDGSDDDNITASTSGTYWVDLTFGPDCQVRDSIELQPQIYSNTELGDDLTLCEGDTLSLDVSIEGGSFLWHDDSTDPIFTTTESGKYFVQVDYEGCPNADTISVVFQPLPTPNLGSNQLACKDEVVTLNPNTAYTSLFWNDVSQLENLEVTEPGIYWVEVINGSCSARDSVEISYFDIENFLGADTSLCEGESIRLEGPADGLISYTWNDGSNGSVLLVDEPDTYGLTLSREDCELFDDIEVALKPQPSLSIGRDTAFCEGDVLTISPMSNGDRFEWSNGDVSQNTTVSEEGTYQVIAYLNDCPANDYITVFMDQRPEINLGNDTTICTQRPLNFNLGNGFAEVIWSDGFENAQRTINTSGNYGVTLIDGACTVTDDINIVADECAEFKVFAPNIFSPDGDGVNDEFKPFFDIAIQVSDYKLLIFNRWGGVVFETNDIEEAWDGTLKGKLLQRGTYVYSMEFSYEDELESGQRNVNGDVLLVR